MTPEEYRERKGNSYIHLLFITILVPLFYFALDEYFNKNHDSHKVAEPIASMLTALVVLIYMSCRDYGEAEMLLEAFKQKGIPVPTPRKKEENTFQKKLDDAGFTQDDIINHPKLSLFYDPVTQEVTENPAITNTEDVVDEETAANIIKNNTRLFSDTKVTFFSGSPALKKLLNQIVTEAIEEKKTCSM